MQEPLRLLSLEDNVHDSVQIVTLPTTPLSTPAIFPKGNVCSVSLAAPTPSSPPWRNELYPQCCSLDGWCYFDDYCALALSVPSQLPSLYDRTAGQKTASYSGCSSCLYINVLFRNVAFHLFRMCM